MKQNTLQEMTFGLVCKVFLEFETDLSKVMPFETKAYFMKFRNLWVLSFVLVSLVSCSSTSDSRSNSSRVSNSDQILATVGRIEITSGELKNRILDRYYGELKKAGFVPGICVPTFAPSIGLTMWTILRPHIVTMT